MWEKSWLRRVVLVVLDTNIIVSALLFGGRASRVHQAWVEGTFDFLFSDSTIMECRRVLAYPKFGLTADDVTYLLDEELLPFARIVPFEGSPEKWIPEDPEDDKFIALALVGEADFLVSGDAHIFARRYSLPCHVFSLTEFLGKIEALPGSH